MNLGINERIANIEDISQATSDAFGSSTQNFLQILSKTLESAAAITQKNTQNKQFATQIKDNVLEFISNSDSQEDFDVNTELANSKVLQNNNAITNDRYFDENFRARLLRQIGRNKYIMWLLAERTKTIKKNGPSFDLISKTANQKLGPNAKREIRVMHKSPLTIFLDINNNLVDNNNDTYRTWAQMVVYPTLALFESLNIDPNFDFIYKHCTDPTKKAFKKLDPADIEFFEAKIHYDDKIKSAQLKITNSALESSLGSFFDNYIGNKAVLSNPALKKYILPQFPQKLKIRNLDLFNRLKKSYSSAENIKNQNHFCSNLLGTGSGFDYYALNDTELIMKGSGAILRPTMNLMGGLNKKDRKRKASSSSSSSSDDSDSYARPVQTKRTARKKTKNGDINNITIKQGLQILSAQVNKIQQMQSAVQPELDSANKFFSLAAYNVTLFSNYSYDDVGFEPNVVYDKGFIESLLNYMIGIKQKTKGTKQVVYGLAELYEKFIQKIHDNLKTKAAELEKDGFQTEYLRFFDFEFNTKILSIMRLITNQSTQIDELMTLAYINDYDLPVGRAPVFDNEEIDSVNFLKMTIPDPANYKNVVGLLYQEVVYKNREEANRVTNYLNACTAINNLPAGDVKNWLISKPFNSKVYYFSDYSTNFPNISNEVRNLPTYKEYFDFVLNLIDGNPARVAQVKSDLGSNGAFAIPNNDPGLFLKSGTLEFEIKSSNSDLDQFLQFLLGSISVLNNLKEVRSNFLNTNELDLNNSGCLLVVDGNRMIYAEKIIPKGPIVISFLLDGIDLSNLYAIMEMRKFLHGENCIKKTYVANNLFDLQGMQDRIDFLNKEIVDLESATKLDLQLFSPAISGDTNVDNNQIVNFFQKKLLDIQMKKPNLNLTIEVKGPSGVGKSFLLMGNTTVPGFVSLITNSKSEIFFYDLKYTGCFCFQESFENCLNNPDIKRIDIAQNNFDVNATSVEKFELSPNLQCITTSDFVKSASSIRSKIETFREAILQTVIKTVNNNASSRSVFAIILKDGNYTKTIIDSPGSELVLQQAPTLFSPQVELLARRFVYNPFFYFCSEKIQQVINLATFDRNMGKFAEAGLAILMNFYQKPSQYITQAQQIASSVPRYKNFYSYETSGSNVSIYGFDPAASASDLLTNLSTFKHFLTNEVDNYKQCFTPVFVQNVADLSKDFDTDTLFTFLNSVPLIGNSNLFNYFRIEFVKTMNQNKKLTLEDVLFFPLLGSLMTHPAESSILGESISRAPAGKGGVLYYQQVSIGGNAYCKIDPIYSMEQSYSKTMLLYSIASYLKCFKSGAKKTCEASMTEFKTLLMSNDPEMGYALETVFINVYNQITPLVKSGGKIQTPVRNLSGLLKETVQNVSDIVSNVDNIIYPLDGFLDRHVFANGSSVIDGAAYGGYSNVAGRAPPGNELEMSYQEIKMWMPQNAAIMQTKEINGSKSLYLDRNVKNIKFLIGNSKKAYDNVSAQNNYYSLFLNNKI